VIVRVVPLDVTDSVSPFGKKSYPVEIAPRMSENFFICDLAKG